MNLGIAGRTALVCGASKGLGRACAVALAAEGVELSLVARGRESLDATAREIQAAHGVAPRTIVADLSVEAGVDATLAGCPGPDILIVNVGGPPLGGFRRWDRKDWSDALSRLLLSAIALIEPISARMVDRRWGRIVTITSAFVKAPLDELCLSTSCRSGLIGFVASIARSLAPHDVTINNILPGPFETERTGAFLASEGERLGASLVAGRARLVDRVPAGRLGSPRELGALCAYLCGDLAGFISGQNIAIDGALTLGTVA